MSLDLDAIKKRNKAAQQMTWDEEQSPVYESQHDIGPLLVAVETLRGALRAMLSQGPHRPSCAANYGRGPCDCAIAPARAALEATAPPAGCSPPAKETEPNNSTGYDPGGPPMFRCSNCGDPARNHAADRELEVHGCRLCECKQYVPAHSRSEARRLEVQRGEKIAPVSAVLDASPAAIGPCKGQRRDVDAASSPAARMAQEAATFPPCVTHHYACDCREAEFAALRVRLEAAERACIEEWGHVPYFDAATRGDGEPPQEFEHIAVDAQTNIIVAGGKTLEEVKAKVQELGLEGVVFKPVPVYRAQNKKWGAG